MTGGKFFAVFALYLAQFISPEDKIFIALAIPLLIAIGQILMLPFFGDTPLELCTQNKKQQALKELNRIYKHKTAAQNRLRDIEYVASLTVFL